MSSMHPRIVMVSNRLPIRLVDGRDGPAVTESPGGLVRALGAIMRRRGDVWIGWAGVDGEVDLDGIMAESGTDLGYRLDPVPINHTEHAHYYKGFANEVLWPLFHDLHTYCRFEERYWTAYKRINARFAEHVRREANPDDIVWVHDYHLMLTAKELREQEHNGRLGFFLHIPFPSPDVFKRMPWRDELLEGLLHFDILGFQTRHDLDNFIQTVRALNPDALIRRPEWLYEIHVGDRHLRAGAFPIGIDVDEIRSTANRPSVARRAADFQEMFGDRKVILGVDRLDYTKGIPDRLRAYGRMLADHPELHGKVVFVQHASPSREEVAGYARLKREVERLVGQINGKYGSFEWTPVQYLHNTVDFDELIALYRAADVAFVTPLKDGMNLVALEYCAAQQDDPGVLVLSEFAGAAQSAAQGALLVNPHDVHEMAQALHRAIIMEPEERRRRHDDLMDAIRAGDVFGWVESFLEAAVIRPPTQSFIKDAPSITSTHG